MDPILSIGGLVAGLVAGGAAGAFYKGKTQTDEFNKKLELLKRENATLIEQGNKAGAADSNRLRQQEEEIKRLKKRETEREDEFKKLNKNATEQAENVKKLTAQITELTASVKAAEEMAQRVRQEATEAAAQVERTRDISADVAELKKLTQSLEEMELQALTAQEELAVAQTRLVEAESLLTDAISERDSAQAALAPAQAELEAIRTELATLRAELETLRNERPKGDNGNKTELEQAQSEISRIHSDLIQARAEREALEKDQETRYQRLQEFAERQVGKLQEENRALKAAAASAATGDAAEENYHALTAIAPDGVFEADTEGNWTFASDAWTKLTGLSAANSKGSGWLKAVLEADRPEIAETWKEAVSNRQVFQKSFRLTNAQGNLRLVSIKARAVRGSGNYLGVIEDVTEIRRIEEGMRSANLCLRSVVEAATEGIVVLNKRGDITSWNRAAFRMFGFTEDEAKGRNITALLVPDDRPTLKKGLDAAAKAIATNEPQVMEVLALCKDGKSVPIEVSVAAWPSGDIENELYFTGTMRDVTERRQAEDFRRAKETAEESNRAKSQFLANMSHELRTPLNAIIGFSEILHDRTFGELTPKQDRYVGNILQSGRHLLQLINDILDISKVEAGHMQVEYVAFPVAVAVRNIENMVKVLLSKKNITLEVDIPGDLPVLIADQAKFKQIIYNLVSNAIKFTPDGGKVIINAWAIDNNSTLQVAVKDTGIGIKPEDQERVFREFEQVDNSYARQQQGTGLGLSLVRKFVNLHGGKISVFSEGEGKGTTFTFTMPFTPPEQKPSVAESLPTPNETAAPTGGLDAKATVLVVEDDQNASELLTLHLQTAGYSVARTGSGAEAVRIAREAQPSVITLDVNLTDGDGWGVLEALRKEDKTRDIPVIMVSIVEDKDRAQSFGVTDTFTKPVVKENLLKAIAKNIEARANGRTSDPTSGAVPIAVNGETATNGAAPTNASTTNGKRNGRSRG